MSLMTFITACLSCSMLGLIVVAAMAFREILNCGKERAAGQAHIITLLAKIEDIQRDNLKNYSDLTEKVNSCIIQCSNSVAGLQRFFENNALTERMKPLEQEEGVE